MFASSNSEEYVGVDTIGAATTVKVKTDPFEGPSIPVAMST